MALPGPLWGPGILLLRHLVLCSFSRYGRRLEAEMATEAIPITTAAQVRRMAALKIPEAVIASLIRWPIASVREALRD